MKTTCLVLLGILAGAGAPLVANEISPEELERWFNSNSMEPPRYKEVNDGELVFLDKPPEKVPHHHHNSLTIQPTSLQDGWIILEQCHTNLAQVEAAQVVFNKERVRDITILSYRNMERAWVEDASVQMTNIKADAKLCIKASSRALVHNADGTYSLRNGPFMRRYLDGYFPIRVSLDLNYAATGLKLVRMHPAAQAGYKVTQGDGTLHIDALFEGRLETEFQFRNKNL